MDIEKLYPETKDYIWGGNKLREYGKTSDKDRIAESWELSFHPDGPSRLADGRLLKDVATKRDWGENAARFPFFPILIKFIDAKDNLSVQVHPSDEYALANEGQFGKSEMWYIAEAEEGAGIYLGFGKDVTAEEFGKAIEEGTVLDLLNFFKVKKGEHYFIGAGTVHAIGKGCVIAEIQQNSNLTYRVYDYGRKDKNGKGRELHVDKAKKVANLSKFVYDPLNADYNGGKLIGECKYFKVAKYVVGGEKKLTADEKSFKAVTVLSGSGSVGGRPAKKGDTFFVPAAYGAFAVDGSMEILVSEV